MCMYVKDLAYQLTKHALNCPKFVRPTDKMSFSPNHPPLNSSYLFLLFVQIYAFHPSLPLAPSAQRKTLKYMAVSVLTRTCMQKQIKKPHLPTTLRNTDSEGWRWLGSCPFNLQNMKPVSFMASCDMTILAFHSLSAEFKTTFVFFLKDSTFGNLDSGPQVSIPD